VADRYEVAVNLVIKDNGTVTLERIGSSTEKLNRKFKSAQVGANQFRGSMLGLNNTSKTLIRNLGAMAGITGGVMLFRGAIKGAIEFEKQLKEVESLLDQELVPMMGTFRKGILDLAKSYGEGTASLTKGLYDIISASIPAEKALGVLEEATKAGKAGLSSTAAAADVLTTVINSYGMSADDASDVSDTLFTTVKYGKTTFDALAHTVGRIASTAAAAGISFEEVGAALATMTRAGLSTDEAVVALNQTLLTFLSPTKDAVEAAKKHGLALNAETLQTKGLIGTMAELKGITAEQSAEIFTNIRAMRGAIMLINDTEGAQRDLENQMNNLGSTQKALATNMSTVDQKIKEYKASWDALVKSGSEHWLPFLGDTFELLTGINEAIASLPEKMPMPEGKEMFDKEFRDWWAKLWEEKGVYTPPEIKPRTLGETQAGIMRGLPEGMPMPEGYERRVLSYPTYQPESYWQKQDESFSKKISEKRAKEIAELKALGKEMKEDIDLATQLVEVEERSDYMRRKRSGTFEADLVRSRIELQEDGLRKIAQLLEVELDLVDKSVENRNLTYEEGEQKKLAMEAEYRQKSIDFMISNNNERLAEIREARSLEIELENKLAEGKLAVLEDSYEKGLIKEKEYIEQKQAIVSASFQRQIDELRRQLSEEGLSLTEANIIEFRIAILEEEQKQAIADVDRTVGEMEEIAEEGSRTITRSMSSFVDSAITDFDNMGDAFAQTIQGMLSDLSQLAMQKAIWEPVGDWMSDLFGSGLSSLGGGGDWGVEGVMPDVDLQVQSGGHIPGSGSGDIVPAMLEPGEYVIPKKRVQQLGVGYLEGLRRGYQEGGIVGSEPFRVSPFAVYNPNTGFLTIGGGTDFKGAVYSPEWYTKAMWDPSISGTWQIWNMGIKQPFQRREPAPPTPPTPGPPTPPPPGPEPPLPIPEEPQPPPPPTVDPNIPPPEEPIPDWLLPQDEAARNNLPAWAQSLYDIFGYSPQTGVPSPFIEPKGTINRWKMPAITQPIQDLLNQFGFQASPLIGIPYDYFGTYGAWAEPLFALSMITGLKSPYLTAIPDIAQLLTSGFPGVIEEVPAAKMSKEKLAEKLHGMVSNHQNILESNAYGGELLADMLEGLYYSLGTRGTLAVENPSISSQAFDRMADLYRNYYDAYMDSSEGFASSFSMKQKHAGYIYARGYYDYVVAEMMRSLSDLGPFKVGDRPAWVGAHYLEGPASPGAWFPTDFMSWMKQTGAYDPFKPFPNKTEDQYTVSDWLMLGTFKDAFPEWRKYRQGGVVGLLEPGETVLPKKYHQGGIVGQEGAGGVSISPRVTININNQTGIPIEAEEEFSMSDFEGVVKSIVIKANSRDPRFRNVMRGR